MGKRALWLGAGLLVACVVGALFAWRASRAEWQLSAPVLLGSIGAEVLYLDGRAVVRRGPPRVVVVRFGRPMELVPHHFQRHALAQPQPVDTWADALDAPVVINAGQFDEDKQHLGWLKSGGQWIEAQSKPAWKALLVSGPVAGPPWAGIVDLEQANPAVVEGYAHAIQSMMLVDEGGRVRVRESERTACRTVVAQDRQGRVLFIVTEGATTLADLARWLPQTPLDIVRAMNMDGGVESQLAIRTPELTLSMYGQYGTGTTVLDGTPGQIRYPLPAVIAARTASPTSE